mmetsp:Transcript_28756/g.66800  ORF Transcript_28756/g.66800 Transcript_28756/m.66800 type:complete len:250 (+) Transcript_28756:52-801(+)
MVDDTGFASAGGLFGRFENVRFKKSAKRIVPCEAATAEYLRHDYVKHSHLPPHLVDGEANYAPSSNLNETRFHKGFQRRHVADIQPDAARLEKEIACEAKRDERARQQVEVAKAFKEKVTFNILTGEGVGRECEFVQTGKKILNPGGDMQAAFGQHGREASLRMKQSKHRYFEHPAPPSNEVRSNLLFNEGLTHTQRESATIGYGKNGNARTRTQSLGAPDNFGHLKGRAPDRQYDQPFHGNSSQIILG